MNVALEEDATAICVSEEWKQPTSFLFAATVSAGHIRFMPTRRAILGDKTLIPGVWYDIPVHDGAVILFEGGIMLRVDELPTALSYRTPR